MLEQIFIYINECNLNYKVRCVIKNFYSSHVFLVQVTEYPFIAEKYREFRSIPQSVFFRFSQVRVRIKRSAEYPVPDCEFRSIIILILASFVV